jgi:vancomycin resistance protein YoaR
VSFFDSGALREGARPVRRRRTWMVLLVFVALAIAGYVAAHRYAEGRVPVGVSVEGVSIGGLPRDEALARLESRLGADLATPVELTYNDQTYRLDAATSGVRIDYAATLSSVGATGSRWAPNRVWRFYTDGGDRPAVIRVDKTRFAQALAALTRRIGRPAVEGTVAFRDGRAVAVHGRSGLAIDQPSTTKLVRSLLFSDHPGELPMTVREPYVSAATVRRAMHAFGTPAMSGPVRLDIGGRTYVVAPALFGKALKMVPHDGDLEPVLDPELLRTTLSSGLRTIGDKAEGATVRLSNGKPVVVPAVYGAAYDADALAHRFLTALTASGSARSVTLHAAITTPSVSTAAARAWGVHTRITSVVVQAPAADLSGLDQHVLAPGHPLKITDALDSPDVAAMSGVFEAALRSGLDISDVTTPTSVRGDLPVGQQASAVTLEAPAGSHVLITVSRLGSRKATLTIWGRRQARVRLTTGPRTDITAPTTTHGSGRNCSTSVGVAGFSVTVHRTGPGEPQSVTSTYAPVDGVTCGPAASATKAP